MACLSPGIDLQLLIMQDIMDKLMHSMDGSDIVTEFIIRVLRLTNCADTPLGNEMIRGVSGGERKRVTLGEMLVGNKVCTPCRVYAGTPRDCWVDNIVQQSS